MAIIRIIVYMLYIYIRNLSKYLYSKAINKPLTKPASTQNDCQTQKNCEACPGDAIQRGFCTAGAAEHGAPACGKASHATAFGAVKQHQHDQQYAGADPGPGQDRSEH